MPAYAEKFPIGSEVQIADRRQLESFRASWRFHNPLTVEQLMWAARRAMVAEVGFYHSGDPLYVLRDVPGVWHEDCLTATAVQAT
jgi:hypothetical protein